MKTTIQKIINNSKTKIMKQTTLFTFFVIALFGLFLTGCQQDDDLMKPEIAQTNQTSAKILTESEIQQQIIPIIQSFLNSQYEYLMKKEQKPQWNVISGSDILQQEIDNYKSLTQQGTTIVFYRSKIKWHSGEIIPGRIGSFQQSGDKLTIYNIVEDAALTYSYVENNITENFESGIGVPYDEVVLTFTNGKWMIESWKEKGPFGLYPRWYREQPSEQTEPIINIDSSISNKILITYNRTAAKNYAHAHVFSPSSNYPDYSSYGGDCTNFVSQCLQAGGWNQVSSGSYKWFHLPGYTSPPPSGIHRSPSWTAADYLKTYIANSGSIVLASYPLSSMEIGDVVHLISGGSAYHTMLVTKKIGSGSSSRTFVTYRNASGYSPEKDIEITGLSESSMIKYKIANSYWSLA